MTYPEQKNLNMKTVFRWLFICFIVIAFHITLYFFYMWHKDRANNQSNQTLNEKSNSSNVSSNSLTNTSFNENISSSRLKVSEGDASETFIVIKANKEASTDKVPSVNNKKEPLVIEKGLLKSKNVPSVDNETLLSKDSKQNQIKPLHEARKEYDVKNLPSSSTDDYPITTPINVNNSYSRGSKEMETAKKLTKEPVITTTVSSNIQADENKSTNIKVSKAKESKPLKSNTYKKLDYSKNKRVASTRNTHSLPQEKPINKPKKNSVLLDIDLPVDSKGVYSESRHYVQGSELNQVNQQLSDGVNSVKDRNRRKIAEDRQREYQAYMHRKRQNEQRQQVLIDQQKSALSDVNSVKGETGVKAEISVKPKSSTEPQNTKSKSEATNQSDQPITSLDSVDIKDKKN